MKKKLLITGASGFLGYHLLRLAYGQYEVYGLYLSKDFDFVNAVHTRCDITNYIELGNLFDDIEPDAVIHTAAMSDADFCQNNRDISFSVNVEATKNLAGICSDFNIPFAFISTDLVFDGKKGTYKEDDARNPVSVYGEQKSLAEDEVLKIYPKAVVFRAALMFGYPEASSFNYMQKFLSLIRQGKTAKLFTDEYRSVCGAKSIAEGILLLLKNNSGIIHVAGKEKLSRYDFGKKTVKAFGLDERMIEACSQKDIQLSAPRPPDVSLDISKASALGFSPMRVDEELKLIAGGKYF